LGTLLLSLSGTVKRRRVRVGGLAVATGHERRFAGNPPPERGFPILDGFAPALYPSVSYVVVMEGIDALDRVFVFRPVESLCVITDLLD
jgi:hypothetical protein